MSSAIIETVGLSAGYGNKQIANDVSLQLNDKEILLMLGHNGAGKTTLMRAIFGLLKPMSGKVLYHGSDIGGQSPAGNVASGIAFVPQGHGIFRSLSVRDNLELGGFVETDNAKLPERIEAVFELFPILKEREKQIGGTMSGGQQQMLAIGMAMMHAPQVIILDEPSIGLAPNLVDRVMQSIVSINKMFGTAILMVEQNVQYSLPIADRALVMKTGTLIYDGAPEHLQDTVKLMEMF